MTKPKPKPLTRTERVLKAYPTPGSQPLVPTGRASRAKPYVRRKRAENEALSRTVGDWRKTVYKPTRVSPLRPGAEDALTHPSRVGSTYYYPLTKEYGPRK